MTGELRPPAPQPPNPARVAIWSFVAGVIIWVGGACLVLRGGNGGTPVASKPSSPGNPVVVSTQPTSARPTVTLTPLPDRHTCEEIRGTDYRSAVERQFFLQNCQPTPAPPPPTPPPSPTP